MLTRLLLLTGLVGCNAFAQMGQLPFVEGKPVIPEAAPEPVKEKLRELAQKPVDPSPIDLPKEVMFPRFPEPKAPASGSLMVASNEQTPNPADRALATDAPMPPTGSLVAEAEEETGDTAGVCLYVVKKGDNLSRILLRLGVLPLYGNNLKKVVEKNPRRIKKEGNLIFPNVRIAIPRSMIAENEACADGKEEKDLNRRIALYSEAEAEIKKGGYRDLCDEVKNLAEKESHPGRKGRFLHLAAVCHYEEGNLDAAHRLWSQVLALGPDASLKYRATYNMALVECQTDKALQGYEKLRGVSPSLWQTQASFERRTFLDLAAYCAEKGVSSEARMDMIVKVYLTSDQPELRTYAAEKLRADFTNRQHCQLTEKIVAKFSEKPELDEWRMLWGQTCR